MIKKKRWLIKLLREETLNIFVICHEYNFDTRFSNENKKKVSTNRRKTKEKLYRSSRGMWHVKRQKISRVESFFFHVRFHPHKVIFYLRGNFGRQMQESIVAKVLFSCSGLNCRWCFNFVDCIVESFEEFLLLCGHFCQDLLKMKRLRCFQKYFLCCRLFETISSLWKAFQGFLNFEIESFFYFFREKSNFLKINNFLFDYKSFSFSCYENLKLLERRQIVSFLHNFPLNCLKAFFKVS